MNYISTTSSHMQKAAHLLKLKTFRFYVPDTILKKGIKLNNRLRGSHMAFLAPPHQNNGPDLQPIMDS